MISLDVAIQKIKDEIAAVRKENEYVVCEFEDGEDLTDMSHEKVAAGYEIIGLEKALKILEGLKCRSKS